MNKAHPLRDAGLAISLMTIVPTSARMPEDGTVPQVAGWFPAVGLALGAVGYTLVKVVGAYPLRHAQPFLLAALIVTFWAIATRMMHLDGLADVADGYWGSHDPARRLEIMSDSHVGAFGASAITLVLIVEIMAIGSINFAPHELPLLLVPAIARFSATAGCWLGKPARQGGLGRSVMARPTVLGAMPALVVFVGVAAVSWLIYGVTGAVLFTVGILLALGIPHVLARRFGGVTGDVLGASVLLTETILFVAFALVG
ncbi:MAG: adenosylcobinamide-GDP ribazoletransferase [Coriobacteriia bacterium]